MSHTHYILSVLLVTISARIYLVDMGQGTIPSRSYSLAQDKTFAWPLNGTAFVGTTGKQTAQNHNF